MRQLVFDAPGRLRWADAADPEVAPRGALVRPLAVATCDLDTAILRGAAPVGGPFSLGHEAVGRVVAVGEDVRTVATGDVVAISFQISCGRCERCARGQTGHCQAHGGTPMFGLGPLGGTEWGGLLADLAHVPYADAMLVPLPPSVDPVAAASASDNIADAYRTVAAPLAEHPGADVLVVGGGAASIGLYAAGLAVALGAGTVAYADTDERRLGIAETLGAVPLPGRYPGRVGSFPVTVDASGSEVGLACALRSTDLDGTCTSSSMFFEDPSLPMFDMYLKGVTLRTGRVHGRALLPEVLQLLESRRFDPMPVVGAVVPWEEAPEHLAHPVEKTILVRE